MTTGCQRVISCRIRATSINIEMGWKNTSSLSPRNLLIYRKKSKNFLPIESNRIDCTDKTREIILTSLKNLPLK